MNGRPWPGRNKQNQWNYIMFFNDRFWLVFKNNRFQFRNLLAEPTGSCCLHVWPNLWLLLIAGGVRDVLTGDFWSKCLGKIVYLLGTTCIVFLQGFFVFCDSFWVVVHVCFHTYVASVAKLLLWCINTPMLVDLWSLAVDIHHNQFGLCWVCVYTFVLIFTIFYWSSFAQSLLWLSVIALVRVVVF